MEKTASLLEMVIFYIDCVAENSPLKEDVRKISADFSLISVVF